MQTLSSFLLIFRDSSADPYKALSSEERQHLLAKWNSWYEGLAVRGKVRHGHPLEQEGRLVAGDKGELVVDVLESEPGAMVGYFFLTVEGIDEATQIAQQCPNLPYGMRVEVRPVGDCCRLASSVAQSSGRDLIKT